MMRLTLPLALTAAIAIAGCGSSSSSSDSNSSAGGGTSSTSAAAPPAADGAVAIDMKNIAFSPKDATAKVGQKVTWTNKDSVSHNVIADKGEFKSSDFGQNGTYSFTPTKAGTIKYQCTLHPG